MTGIRSDDSSLIDDRRTDRRTASEKGGGTRPSKMQDYKNMASRELARRKAKKKTITS